MTRNRVRQLLEVAFGVAPICFLLPFLWAGGLGVVVAMITNGAIDRMTATLVVWVTAATLGSASLVVVVLLDEARRVSAWGRLVLASGLLLGVAGAGRLLWTSWTSRYRYGALSWVVWLYLLGGPVVIAGLRLVQLVRSLLNRGHE